MTPDFLPDLHLMRGFTDVDEAYDDANRRNHHRINEATERDSGALNYRSTDGRDAATEPAVADVIRHRHRAVTDLGREQFYKEGGDRPVDHGHQDHEVEHQYEEHYWVVLEGAHPRKDGPVGGDGEGESERHDVSAADAIGQRAENQEEERSHRERDHHDDVDGDVIYLQRGGHIEQRIELARVPHDTFGCCGAEQRNCHEAPVLAAAVRLFHRIERGLSLLFQP